MVDRDLVNGMMLRQRRVTHCEACHMGKERKPPTKKSLDRETTRKERGDLRGSIVP
ncbi:hypothetical protein Pcac1_g597 [Phytophthora cactorum]|nr:hypothetical protein Pcac1_g597 [Phytophthora cactorum]